MEIITFDELAKLSVFKKFYSLANSLFGVSIALMKPDSIEGLPLGPADQLNPFCLHLQSDPQGFKRCQNCDYLHQQEAKRQKTAVRYNCHAGLTDFVIPIIVGEKTIAYLQCGQILDRSPTEDEWNTVRNRFQGLSLDTPELRKHYFATRVIPPPTQKHLIELLELFANYLADAGTRLLLFDKHRKSHLVYLAESYIRAHAGEGISIADVAREVFSSKRNLTRVFRAETGMTVHDMINRVRLEHAGEMLAEGTHKISTVAFDCGFGTVQQFNRNFRRATGQTPREWRSRNTGPGGPER